MRRFASSFVLALPLLVSQPQTAGAGDPAAEPEWKVLKDKNGLRLSSRSFAGSSVNELRVEGVFEFPAERIFAVLADVETYPTMMPPTVVAQRLKGGGDQSWYYMEINPPVVSRRFYCMKMKMSRLQGGVLRSEWDMANDLCPAKQGQMVRMEENRGAWTLVPIDEGHTQVTYQAHSDPGGQIPAWMVNKVAGSSLLELFGHLRKAAALPRYAQR